MSQKQIVQGIIIQDNKVLFGSGMINKKYVNRFFIGGGLGKEETLEEAMLRGLKEEIRVDGEIIFKFTNEFEKNHHTFLININNQEVSLEKDTENISNGDRMREIQKLEFIPLKEYNRFSLIDRAYFKIVIDECDERKYFPSWYDNMKALVEGNEL